MVKENLVKFTYSAIFGLTLIVAAAAPLFFLPTTAEFFEFNKFTLLLFTTVAGAILWSVRMALLKRFSFTRTPLDIPLLLLLLVFFIAAFSSIDQRIALFGTPPRPWPSFIALLTLTIFYFVASSNIRSKKSVEIVLYTLSGATAAAAMISIISYFGAFLPFDFAKYRGFTTTGSVNSLAVLNALIIPLTLSWVLFAKQNVLRAASALATAILFISLVLLNFTPAYFSLLVGLILVGAVALKTGKISKKSQIAFAAVTIFALTALAARFIPQVSNSLISTAILGKDKNLEINKSLTLPQNTGWDIAASTIGKRPLFGTGPGTFPFAYTQLKPRAVNGTDFWRVRFDKSSSDATELVATTGIVGIAAFLIFVAVTVRFIWSLLFKSGSPTVYLPAGTLAVTFLASQFFATSSISAVVPFIVALASIVVIAKSHDEKHVHEVVVEVATLRNTFGWLPTGSKKLAALKTSTQKTGTKSQILPYLFLVIAAAVSFFGVKTQAKAFQAEYYYRQALLAAAGNDGNSTIRNLQLAIAANSGVDIYHRELSATALNAALTLSQQKDLTDEQKQLIGQLAQVAIDQGKVASGYQILPLRLPGISASNPANWETVSAAYQALIGQVAGADVNTINTLAQASALDPENPVLRHRLGIVYRNLKNLDLAKRHFEDAIVTKVDFGPAHYDLALILIEQKGNAVAIAQELTLAKRFLPGNDPAIADIDKKLEEYNKLVQELQTQGGPATSPSPSPGASPSPSARPTPSPSPTIKPSL